MYSWRSFAARFSLTEERAAVTMLYFGSPSFTKINGLFCCPNATAQRSIAEMIVLTRNVFIAMVSFGEQFYFRERHKTLQNVFQ
jgi:hypothetical protein